MDLGEFASLTRLANPYAKRYATTPEKEIRPKPTLTGERFTMTMLSLVSGTNGEGFDHALTEVFGDDEPPYRASFSKARKAVSWTFFRDGLLGLVRAIDARRTTFGGLKLFAIDGHQLILPYTKDLYAAGYSGRYLENERETYTLRAYMGHCYDVLTGITSDVTFSPTLDEHRDRRSLLPSVPDGSLVLYDRLYFSEDLAISHAGRDKVYFLCRCKSTASREVAALFADTEKMTSSTRRYGRRITFFKVIHPDTGEATVYATDLPESWHKPELIRRLYRMRWETETEQRDITETTVKLEQWHSTTLNGILQEFYATLWLVNVVRLSMLLAGQKSASPEDDVYRKPNFKLAFNVFVKRLAHWLSAPGALLIKLARVIRRSLETRRRYSRRYPREIKSPQSPYAYNNTVASKARPPPRR
jgi:hypothetical protein